MGAMTREMAASMAATRALQIANLHRSAPHAGARFLTSRWGSDDHALADAEHVLRRVLGDTDPSTLDALHLVNALVAIVDAAGNGVAR